MAEKPFVSILDFSGAMRLKKAKTREHGSEILICIRRSKR
jgi:hypothetical protein